jgi:hypothetical protein
MNTRKTILSCLAMSLMLLPAIEASAKQVSSKTNKHSASVKIGKSVHSNKPISSSHETLQANSNFYKQLDSLEISAIGSTNKADKILLAENTKSSKKVENTEEVKDSAALEEELKKETLEAKLLEVQARKLNAQASKVRAETDLLLAENRKAEAQARKDLVSLKMAAEKADIDLRTMENLKRKADLEAHIETSKLENDFRKSLISAKNEAERLGVELNIANRKNTLQRVQKQIAEGKNSSSASGESEDIEK